MNALERYQQKRQAVQEAEAFVALLQGAITDTNCSIGIIRNGQTTAMPESMRAAVSAAVASRAATVLNAAIATLRQDALTAGLQAREEYLNLLQADGIITQGG